MTAQKPPDALAVLHAALTMLERAFPLLDRLEPAPPREALEYARKTYDGARAAVASFEAAGSPMREDLDIKAALAMVAAALGTMHAAMPAAPPSSGVEGPMGPVTVTVPISKLVGRNL